MSMCNIVRFGRNPVGGSFYCLLQPGAGRNTFISVKTDEDSPRDRNGGCPAIHCQNCQLPYSPAISYLHNRR
jgi:hypothetical protein